MIREIVVVVVGIEDSTLAAIFAEDVRSKANCESRNRHYINRNEKEKETYM